MLPPWDYRVGGAKQSALHWATDTEWTDQTLPTSSLTISPHSRNYLWIFLFLVSEEAISVCLSRTDSIHALNAPLSYTCYSRFDRGSFSVPAAGWGACFEWGVLEFTALAADAGEKKQNKKILDLL